jgi:hypothetical protein
VGAQVELGKQEIEVSHMLSSFWASVHKNPENKSLPSNPPAPVIIPTIGNNCLVVSTQ